MQEWKWNHKKSYLEGYEDSVGTNCGYCMLHDNKKKYSKCLIKNI